MQSFVNCSWTPKTFAQARCNSDFGGDKKPRSRRTKEERKTMVESFINKYQNLNNGKFPSLNLTHKEVGGSFYTVREIVREIIQQNRVLCPGNSTSKALSLEYCPEELTGESLSMDISAPLSISTINAVDWGQGESLLSNECGKTSLETIEGDEFVNQENLEYHPHLAFASEVMDDEQHSEIFTGAYKLENLSSKEFKLGKLQAGNENSGVCEQTHADVQVHGVENPGKVEHSAPSSKTVPMTALCESVVNGDDDGDRSNGMIGEIKFSTAISLSETNILLDPVPGFASSSSVSKDLPPASADAETSDTGRSQKIVGITIPPQVLKTSDSDEAKLPFVPFERDSCKNLSETTEILSSILVNEASAASSSTQQSIEKDSIVDRPEMMETLSAIAVDNVSNGSLNQSVSQNMDSPALGRKKPFLHFNATETLSSFAGDEVSNENLNGSVSQDLVTLALESTRPVVHPMRQPNDFKNAITTIESAPVESIQPTFKGKSYSEEKPEHEHAPSSIERSKNSGSISQSDVSKKSETSEVNPIWTTIKSLLNAIVKFWTE